jgi:hypothetical protein
MAAFCRKPLRGGTAKLFHPFDDEHFNGPPGSETEQIFLDLFWGGQWEKPPVVFSAVGAGSL